LPDAITAHVPSGDEAVSEFRHDMHTSVHGLSQQTLSTQLPEAHCDPVVHACPFTI